MLSRPSCGAGETGTELGPSPMTSLWQATGIVNDDTDIGAGVVT
jgi:hypothetical protein